MDGKEVCDDSPEDELTDSQRIYMERATAHRRPSGNNGSLSLSPSVSFTLFLCLSVCLSVSRSPADVHPSANSARRSGHSTNIRPNSCNERPQLYIVFIAAGRRTI